MKDNKSRIMVIYTVLLTVLTYLPILVVAVYSFNGSRISSVFSGFSLKWYGQLFRDDAIFEALANSLIIAVASSLIAAIIATSAALFIGRAKLPFKRAVEKMSLFPLIIPEIILGMVFLAFFSLLGLPFGMLTLIIAHTTFCIPYVYNQVKARLEVMDTTAVEAARDLGASPFKAFLTVTLPMLMPAIVSGMFLSFAMSFDDVIISIFVTGVEVNTLPIIVYTSLKTGVTPKINAICTLMLVITVICYVIAGIIGRKKEKR